MTVSGARFAGMSLLSPTLQSYWAPPMVPIYLCDQFTDDFGTTYYYDETSSSWSTSSAAGCRLAISGGTEDPILDPVYGLRDFAMSAVCTALAIVRGVPGVAEITPDGDVYLMGTRVFDCVSYDISGWAGVGAATPFLMSI